jgi:hypothetical protein
VLSSNDNRNTPNKIDDPDQRFDHVHLDIIILPTVREYRYCLKMITESPVGQKQYQWRDDNRIWLQLSTRTASLVLALLKP